MSNYDKIKIMAIMAALLLGLLIPSLVFAGVDNAVVAPNGGANMEVIMVKLFKRFNALSKVLMVGMFTASAASFLFGNYRFCLYFLLLGFGALLMPGLLSSVLDGLGIEFVAKFAVLAIMVLMSIVFISGVELEKNAFLQALTRPIGSKGKVFEQVFSGLTASEYRLGVDEIKDEITVSGGVVDGVAKLQDVEDVLALLPKNKKDLWVDGKGRWVALVDVKGERFAAWGRKQKVEE